MSNHKNKVAKYEKEKVPFQVMSIDGGNSIMLMQKHCQT